MRALVSEALGGLYRRDRGALLLRVRLILSVPELRARLRDAQAEGEYILATHLAEQRGLPADALAVRVLAAAFTSTILVALEAWGRDDGKGDLLALLDRALAALAEGMRELRI
jgi:hypothetical protein